MASGAAAHFGALGYPLPPETNPAEWLLDLGAGEPPLSPPNSSRFAAPASKFGGSEGGREGVAGAGPAAGGYTRGNGASVDVVDPHVQAPAPVLYRPARRSAPSPGAACELEGVGTLGTTSAPKIFNGSSPENFGSGGVTVDSDGGDGRADPDAVIQCLADAWARQHPPGKPKAAYEPAPDGFAGPELEVRTH